MKLLRFKTIREYRIFRDFSWQAELQPFGCYNAIYGWNGCGKTTLSSLFGHLQDRTNLASGDVEFEFESGVVKGAEVASKPIPQVRVFNQQFVRENLSVAGGRFSPIIILGKENRSRQAELDKIQVELREAGGHHTEHEAAAIKAARDLQKFRTEAAAAIKRQLRDDHHHRYNSYNKANLESDLAALDERTASERGISEEDEIALRTKKSANPLDSLLEVKGDKVEVSELLRETADALATSISASALKELAKDPALRCWIQTGLKVHAQEPDSCGFCGGPLTGERLKALDAHFDTSSRQLETRLGQLVNQCEVTANAIKQLNFSTHQPLYTDLREEYLLGVSILENSKVACLLQLERLKHALTKRLGDIYTCARLEADLPETLERVASEANRAVEAVDLAIQKHNARTTNFAEEIATARDRLADALIAEHFLENRNLALAESESRGAAGAALQRIELLHRRRVQIEQEMRQHNEAAEGLTRDLRSYLGRDELEFVAEDYGYSIRRHTHRADHLSEGEKTAIAFLYFLKHLDDRDFNRGSGVVVIDDPVSSLDANSLFSAFGYMKERTKGCSQLFILTHNFSFFRQVKNWFHHINKRSKGIAKEDGPQARFYQITASWDSTTSPPRRFSSLDRLDPMLREFESEYHYLFKTIFVAQREGISNLELSFPLPNLTRRVLESFLAFRYPQRTGDSWLFAAVSGITFDEGKKNRVLRYLNTHSHSGWIGDGDGDPWSLGEVQEVLSDVLDLIKSEDPAHFNGMVETVTKNEAAE